MNPTTTDIYLTNAFVVYRHFQCLPIYRLLAALLNHQKPSCTTAHHTSSHLLRPPSLLIGYSFDIHQPPCPTIHCTSTHSFSLPIICRWPVSANILATKRFPTMHAQLWSSNITTSSTHIFTPMYICTYFIYIYFQISLRRILPFKKNPLKKETIWKLGFLKNLGLHRMTMLIHLPST